MHENIVRIKAVAQILKGLGQLYVFVGGATVSLYASIPEQATAIRPTDDVDVVVELATYNGYAAIDERLRTLGFVNDAESRVICRYRVQGIIVDVMPTNDTALGFSNRWYPDGFKSAVTFNIDPKTTILIFSLPYFLASKWEAHKSRGGKDLRASKDFEDMVYVWEYCKDFDQQLLNGPAEVIKYFRKEFVGIINTDEFEEAIYSHMESARYGGNTQKIIQPLKKVLGL
jgi:predicted nucleotidyltransferase